MVFESLVSDLLNKFIGDYVENLDKSQLKIGIWGGKRAFVKQLVNNERPSFPLVCFLLQNVLFRYVVQARCTCTAVSINVINV